MKQEIENYTLPICLVVSLNTSGVLLSSSDDVTSIEINDTWVWD